MEPTWLEAHFLTKCASDGAKRAPSMSYLSRSKGTVSPILGNMEPTTEETGLPWLLICAIRRFALRTERLLNSRSSAGPDNLSWIDGCQPQSQFV